MTVDYAQLNAAVLKERLTGQDTLLVNECFGVTFQGEGPSVGAPCVFLRLAGCNQHCSWCDTPFTWKWDEWDPAKEAHERSFAVVAGEIKALFRTSGILSGPRLVVVSGGEPLLQQTRLWRFIHELSTPRVRDWRFEIETAGTIAPRINDEWPAKLVSFNVSPKLANSGNPEQQRYRPLALQRLLATRRAIFKFVVVEESDFDEIDEIVHAIKIPPRLVYVMPEGTSAGAVNEHAQAVAQAVIERGWNLTTRLQVLLYGNRRGV